MDLKVIKDRRSWERALTGPNVKAEGEVQD